MTEQDLISAVAEKIQSHKNWMPMRSAVEKALEETGALLVPEKRDTPLFPKASEDALA